MSSSISPARFSTSAAASPIQLFALRQLDLRKMIELQEWIVRETWSRAHDQISLLLCEHAPLISVGHGAGRWDIKIRSPQLLGRPLDIVEVPRGGGTWLHLPGQLAVYAIAPLQACGWNIGSFLDRFHLGLKTALGELGITAHRRPRRNGLWGNSGQLANFGVAVDHGITSFGATLQVAPTIPLQEYIVSDPLENTPLGSLSKEKQSAVKMTQLRSRLIRHLTESLESERYNFYSDHPQLEAMRESPA